MTLISRRNCKAPPFRSEIDPFSGDFDASSERADPQSFEASFQKGILETRMPKSESAKAGTISIKTNEIIGLGRCSRPVR